MRKLLIIAGSDPSGGAGIQADLKTATAHKIYASAAITCLTVQDTKKVHAIHYAPLDFLEKQIEVVLDDIKFDAIKIGMLGRTEITEVIAKILEKKAKNIPLILDPVMVATSGDSLLKKNAVDVLKNKLIKLSYIITPNTDEAEILTEMKIRNISDMKKAALKLQALGAKNVLIKGGHLDLSKTKIINLLLDKNKEFHLISNKKLNNKKFHGTGCTLASAIACNIAKKNDVIKNVRAANKYVYRAILKNLDIGQGSLILKHY